MSSTQATKSKAKKLSLVAASAMLLVGAGCNSQTNVTADVNTSADANTMPTDTMADANVNVAAGAGMDAGGINMDANTNVDSHVMADGLEDGGRANSYKDGTYKATGHYTSPAGPETIEVTLTLKDDIVTDATVVADATNQMSVKKQGEFIGGYKTQVVGKNLAEINVGKVAGSSLTPKGFNEAVVQIKTEAHI